MQRQSSRSDLRYATPSGKQRNCWSHSYWWWLRCHSACHEISKRGCQSYGFRLLHFQELLKPQWQQVIELLGHVFYPVTREVTLRIAWWKHDTAMFLSVHVINYFESCDASLLITWWNWLLRWDHVISYVTSEFKWNFVLRLRITIPFEEK